MALNVFANKGGQTVPANLLDDNFSQLLASVTGAANAIASHIANTANPHATTAEQVGAQPVSTLLTAIAGLSASTDEFLYFTGSSTAALASVTSFSRGLLAGADANTWRGDIDVYSTGEVETYVTGNAASANYAQGSTGAITRAISARLKDQISLKDFGATGNGSTDDTAAINAFITAQGQYVPAGTYLSTLNLSGIYGHFSGYGQVKTADGNLVAPDFSGINAPPTPGNPDSISTAFNGTLTFCRPAGHFVQGATTLGQPTSGYQFTPEASGRYNVMYVDSTAGYNYSASTNDGRTGVAFNYMSVKHYGNGDAYANYASVFVAGTRTGATDPLATPAGVVLGGQVQFGAQNPYANNIEQNAIDAGYRGSASPFVSNLYRTNADASMDGSGSPAVHFWVGFNTQSQGSVAADVAFRAAGLFKYGFTTTETTLDTNKAAIAIKTDDRIYLSASSRSTGTVRIAGNPGNNYVTASQYGFLNFVYNNASVLQLNDSQVTTLAPLIITSNASYTPSGNSQMAFALTTDTNLRVYGRGSDGVLRHVDLTLA